MPAPVKRSVGPAASASAAKMPLSGLRAGDQTWFARLSSSWWNFNRRHYKIITRVTGVSLIVLVTVEIWLISTIIRTWICWRTPGCFFDGRRRMHYVQPRGNDSSQPLFRQQPTAMLYGTPRLIIIDAYAEFGIKAEDADDAVTVRGRCYGATRVVNFSCTFECSIGGNSGSRDAGDGLENGDLIATLQRLSRATAGEPARARSVAARVQTWQSEYQAFQLSCGGGGEFVAATANRKAATAAATEEADRCETIATVQVTAYVDGVRQSSQKYSLLETPNAMPVLAAGDRGSASPTAAPGRQLSSALRGERGAAAVCASGGGRGRLPRLPHFVEWMEWMLLLGFDRVLVFDDDGLEELAPARDYYVSRNRLTVMRLPSGGMDGGGALVAEAPGEKVMSTAPPTQAKRHYDDNNPFLLNQLALRMLGLGGSGGLARFGVAAPGVGMARDGGTERRRQPSSAAQRLRAADCLEKLSRRYAFVAVLDLGDVIVPLDEPDMLAVFGKLTARASAAASWRGGRGGGAKSSRNEGDGDRDGDVIFHFPGASYYSSFQNQALVGGATRVLSYGRRTRLSPSRGRRVYRAPSMDRFNSSLEWLRRHSATGSVVHVSSLEAWARLYGDDCFSAEGGYFDVTCSDLFEDDPHWLHRFSANVSASAHRVTEIVGYGTQRLW